MLSGGVIKELRRKYRLSKEQILEYFDVFKYFDNDGNGSIEAVELEQVLRKLKVDVSKQELTQMLDSVDADKSGTIEFEEFLNMLVTGEEVIIDPEQEIRDTFRVFDKNGDGFISADELKKVFTQLGEDHITDGDMDRLMQQIDLDGDEQISIEEFARLMRT
ncbi:calmodulin [Acrasis kona]|uniref:Calmodulin n=1 Tax=Acrasis kona TaxID=1008807 RepID=A0AAW2Z063_9EUKA